MRGGGYLGGGWVLGGSGGSRMANIIRGGIYDQGGRGLTWDLKGLGKGGPEPRHV